MLETTVETISPIQAQALLEKKAQNRAISWPQVMVYARDMLAGNWKLTHQGVAFNEAGELVDGQHRLHAIVAANRTVEMQVTRGLEDASRLVIDDHRRRSPADVLAIENGTALNTLFVAILGIMDGPRIANRFSKAELNDAYHLHSTAVAFVVDRLRPKVRGVTVAPILTPIAKAWYDPSSRPRLEDFIKVLCTGIPGEPSADDVSALRLREWLIQGRDMRRRPTPAELFFRASWTLRQFLDRRDVKVIRAAAEDLFPLPADIARSRSTTNIKSFRAAQEKRG